jgi:hypothetical protein
MRWFSIRKANINAELRETFERHGVATMQAILATGDFFRHEDAAIRVADAEPNLLPWLTEQYDRAERKETWSLTMEFAITIFVAVELLLSIIGRR